MALVIRCPFVVRGKLAIPCRTSYTYPDSDQDMALRLRVEELRTAKGWTQEQLAGEAGVSRVTVVRIESREDPPKRVDLEVLEKLADALQVDPSFLIARAPVRRRARG